MKFLFLFAQMEKKEFLMLKINIEGVQYFLDTFFCFMVKRKYNFYVLYFVPYKSFTNHYLF